jgi:hypothetical protein
MAANYGRSSLSQKTHVAYFILELGTNKLHASLRVQRMQQMNPLILGVMFLKDEVELFVHQGFDTGMMIGICRAPWSNDVQAVGVYLNFLDMGGKRAFVANQDTKFETPSDSPTME